MRNPSGSYPLCADLDRRVDRPTGAPGSPGAGSWVSSRSVPRVHRFDLPRISPTHEALIRKTDVTPRIRQPNGRGNRATGGRGGRARSSPLVVKRDTLPVERDGQAGYWPGHSCAARVRLPSAWKELEEEASNAIAARG